MHLMKNIALAIALTLLFAACSSGSSVSALPPTDISGQYRGTFESSNELGGGTVTINLQENGASIVGNLLLTFDPTERTCIINTVLADTSSRAGFNLQLNTSQINFTLTVSQDGRTLEGTYVPLNESCSNASGAGTITLTRIQ